MVFAVFGRHDPMHVRVSRVRRKGKTFEYAQLVESYRRDDGMPAHRVVYNFGRVEEPLLSNLRAAFRGARQGQLLQPMSEAVSAGAIKPPARPQAALRYLDVAVVLEIFRQLDLDRLLDEVTGVRDTQVPDHKVVAALVAQRCVAPDSKLAATRWFPTTALPELLGLAPEQFNNTRIHRALSRLEESTPELMRSVSQHCVKQAGGVRTLFMDITDTWFVGKGPSLAAVAKTKEGMLRRKVGIVLLCNEQGYPLRWEVLQGREAEAPAMLEMLSQLRNVPWIGSAPVVCDRAMGRTAYLHRLAASGLRFITALASPEMQTYYPQLDTLARPLENLRVTSDDQLPEVVGEATRMMSGTAMMHIDETHFVLDAGRAELGSPSGPATESDKATDEPATALRAALAVTEAVQGGRFCAYSDAYRSLGLDPKRQRNLRPLAQLPPDLQQRILAGEFCGQSAFRLAKIAALGDERAQRKAFEQWMHRHPRTAPSAPSPTPPSVAESTALPEAEVRVVLSFNPQVFATQRLTAHRHIESIRTSIAELNAQLAQHRCRITKKGIQQRIDDMLRRRDLVQAFHADIKSVTIEGKERFQVELTRDEANWRQRQSTDGFALLVAHAQLPESAQQISKLYRAKDTVETDFRVIKSQLQLRPVRHHTDLKVRAHVTLCMLALLVERTLRHRLKKTAQRATAERALDILEPLRLCRYPGRKGKDTYLPTQPSPEQSRLLRALKLLHLADPERVATMLTPRPPVVPTERQDSA